MEKYSVTQQLFFFFFFTLYKIINKTILNIVTFMIYFYIQKNKGCIIHSEISL